MSETILHLEHSVEADASLAFAWSFRTDITRWNDPPATFEIDGPFAAGSRGRTLLPSQEPINWRIGTVRPGESFVIEMELPGALLTFEWRFEPLSEHKTRLTQCIELSGDNAATYAKQVEAGFGSTLVDGMKRIAEEIAVAETLSQSAC